MITNNLDRNHIRKQMRRALLPAGRSTNYQKTYWPKWLADRLTTLCIYGFSDKSMIQNPKKIKCLQLYSEGWKYRAIAINQHVSYETAQVYISDALDWVIDNTPDCLLRNIPDTSSRLCPRCADIGKEESLLWDDAEGEYWCPSCARRYTDHVKVIC
jgi:hypothetical protein